MDPYFRGGYGQPMPYSPYGPRYMEEEQPYMHREDTDETEQYGLHHEMRDVYGHAEPYGDHDMFEGEHDLYNFDPYHHPKPPKTKAEAE